MPCKLFEDVKPSKFNTYKQHFFVLSFICAGKQQKDWSCYWKACGRGTGAILSVLLVLFLAHWQVLFAIPHLHQSGVTAESLMSAEHCVQHECIFFHWWETQTLHISVEQWCLMKRHHMINLTSHTVSSHSSQNYLGCPELSGHVGQPTIQE